MAITDVDSTQYFSVAVGTTATGFRGPPGTRYLQVLRGDVAVRVQVADEGGNVAAQDLEGGDLAAPVAAVPAPTLSLSGGQVPASVWHTIALSPADAPSIGSLLLRPVAYLQAAEAITAASEKCQIRFVRNLL